MWINQKTSLCSTHSLNLSIWSSVRPSVLLSTFRLSVFPSEGLPVRPSVNQSVCLSVSQLACQSVSDTVSWCFSHSVTRSGSQSVCQSVRPSVSQVVSQSVCLLVCQSVRPSVRMSVCPSVSQSVSRLLTKSVNHSGRLALCYLFLLFQFVWLFVLWYSEVHWRRMFSQSDQEEKKNLLLSIPSCLGFFKLPAAHQPLDTVS